MLLVRQLLRTKPAAYHKERYLSSLRWGVTLFERLVSQVREESVCLLYA